MSAALNASQSVGWSLAVFVALDGARNQMINRLIFVIAMLEAQVRSRRARGEELKASDR